MEKKFVSKRMGFPARPNAGRDIGFTEFVSITLGPAATTRVRSASILPLEDECLGGEEGRFDEEERGPDDVFFGVDLFSDFFPECFGGMTEDGTSGLE